MALKLITAPTEYPVTRTQAKKQCKIEHDDENDMVDLYVAAATAHVDGPYGLLKRALREQEWELTLDCFPWPTWANPTGAIEIPLPPLQAVSSIKYDDGEGVEQTIDPANYYVDIVSQPGRVVPVTAYSWPTPRTSPGAIRIQFTAGYVEVDSVDNGVPAAIRAAILMIVADMYENRETVTPGQSNKIQVSATVDALLNQYRLHVFA